MRNRKLRLLLFALLAATSLKPLPGRVNSEPQPLQQPGQPIYSALATVKLSGESSLVEGLVLKRDVATFTFKTGKVFFVAPVEGRVTGAVFLGDGEFQLNPVIEYEKRNLSILTKTPNLTDRFTRMTVRFTDSTYQEIKERFGVQSGAADPVAQSSFENTRNELRRGKRIRFNVDARILMDLLGQGSGLFEAFFNGKDFGDMFFGVDPLGCESVNPEETMLAALSEANRGIWYGGHLTEHYQAPSASAENHSSIRVLGYNIDATVKGKNLDAIVQTRFKALVDGARVIPFDLFEKLRLRRVSDADGSNLTFIQEEKNNDGSLFVVLPDALKRGKEYTLKFEYGGDGAVSDSGGGNFTLTDAARDNWYPKNAASPSGDRATLELTLRVPKGLMTVATGQPAGGSEEGGSNTTRWKSDVPIDGAAFNYGRFKKGSSTDDKTRYTFESYANKDVPDYLKGIQLEADTVGTTSTDTTLGSLNTVSMMDKFRAEAQVAVALYTELFGPLPYGRVAMTQQPYFDFGEASPMLVFVPVLAYLDSTYRHQLGLDTTESFVKIVGPHEVAHQWWGCIVGPKSYRDQWMTEGFADFSASLFAEYIYKNDLFLKFWKEQREVLLTKNRLGKRPVDLGSVCMGYRLDTAKTGDVTQAIVYSKGAFIIHMLRMMMWDSKTGDQRFSEMMKDFVKTHYNGNASTQDFQRVVEKHMTPEMDFDGNHRMDWFFQEWVYGTMVPDYKLEYRLEDAQGKVYLIGKITQSNVDAKFKMRVPIYLDMDGKIRRLGSAGIYGNTSSEEFRIALPSRPRKVSLCHFEDVLCTTNTR